MAGERRAAQAPATCGCPASVAPIDPGGLAKSPAYSQAMAVTGNVKTVSVEGQTAVDVDGQIVGAGDLAAQAERAFQNVETALTGAGTKLEHVVKWNIHVVQGQNVQAAFEAYQRAWANRAPPATVTMAYVAGLGAVIELDAIAAVPVSGD